MRYMLLICSQVQAPEPDVVPAPRDASASNDADEPCWMPWAREMQTRGVITHDGAQLQPVTTATTVQNNGGEVLIVDGPFAETKEVIVGYDVIECADLDEAIFAASRHPVALGGGVVEVRPIVAG